MSEPPNGSIFAGTIRTTQVLIFNPLFSTSTKFEFTDCLSNFAGAVLSEVSMQGTVFIQGKKTVLRPVHKSDIPLLLRWINDPEVREFVQGYFPWTERQEEEWYEGLGKNDKNIVFLIEARDDIKGRPIGVMGIHRIDWINRNTTTGAMIGEKDVWGQGYGTDAKLHLLEYAFNTLNLHRISSGAYEFNERSIRYSLRCGYHEEGRRRQHVFRHGRYWDLVELGILRSEWQEVWDRYQKTGSVR